MKLPKPSLLVDPGFIPLFLSVIGISHPLLPVESARDIPFPPLVFLSSDPGGGLF